MSKLKLHPDKSGYAVDLQNGETLEAMLDGGLPRVRLDVLNASKLVNVQWITDIQGYDYLNAFHRLKTRIGSLPFTIDLVLDISAVVEYTAQFKANSLKLTQQSGATYYVSAQLYVTPIFSETQDTDDQATMDAWEAAHPNQE